MQPKPKIKLLLKVLVILPVLISCKKKNIEWSTVVEGKVSDFYSGEILPGAELIIEECIANISYNDCAVKDTVYSDQAGYYLYDLSGIDNNDWFRTLNFQISTVCSENYSASTKYKIENKESNQIDLIVKPLRTLRLMLHDSSKICSKIDLNVVSGNPYLENELYQDTILIDRSEVDTIFFKCIPDEVLYINWRLYSSEGYLWRKYITQIVENVDTINISINY